MELFTYDVSIKELPLMDTNANSDILTKKQNFERVYTSNAIGDVIRIDFGNPWEEALYMNFHIMKKETSKNSYPNVRSCNIRGELFLPFYHKIQKETMIESHWTS